MPNNCDTEFQNISFGEKPQVAYEEQLIFFNIDFQNQQILKHRFSNFEGGFFLVDYYG